MRDQREIQTTASRRFTRVYLMAFAIAALIGLVAGTIWVVTGTLHFHPIW
jgi:hypothetical protein